MSEPRKFRKKPVVIEAMQYRDFDDIDPIMNWVPDIIWSEGEFEIRTLEGAMTASMGDWIIKGVHGEFYPCKPDIFAATYQEATDE